MKKELKTLAEKEMFFCEDEQCVKNAAIFEHHKEIVVYPKKDVKEATQNLKKELKEEIKKTLFRYQIKQDNLFTGDEEDINDLSSFKKRRFEEIEGFKTSLNNILYKVNKAFEKHIGDLK